MSTTWGCNLCMDSPPQLLICCFGTHWILELSVILLCIHCFEDGVFGVHLSLQICRALTSVTSFDCDLSIWGWLLVATACGPCIFFQWPSLCEVHCLWPLTFRLTLNCGVVTLWPWHLTLWPFIHVIYIKCFMLFYIHSLINIWLYIWMHYHITTVNNLLVVCIIMYNKIIYPKLLLSWAGVRVWVHNSLHCIVVNVLKAVCFTQIQHDPTPYLCRRHLNGSLTSSAKYFTTFQFTNPSNITVIVLPLVHKRRGMT